MDGVVSEHVDMASRDGADARSGYRRYGPRSSLTALHRAYLGFTLGDVFQREGEGCSRTIFPACVLLSSLLMLATYKP